MSNTQSPEVTSLMLAVVQTEDADGLTDLLTKRGFRATRIDTRGGFLKESNVIVMVGTDDEGEARVAEAIRETCRTRTTYVYGMPMADPGTGMTLPVEAQIGGAVVFVLPVSWHVRLNDEAIALAGIEQLLGAH
jgi:uncharacterized protein YaaQ